MNVTDGQWQTVQGIKSHKFLVFSAYYDTRDKENPVIRVIGINPIKHSEKVKCRMYFRNENKHEFFVDVPASISRVRDHIKDELYQDCHVLCPLKFIKSSYYEDHIPNSVSIMPLFQWSPSDAKATNKLLVINSKNGGTGTHKVQNTDIGVCVKPIHSHYNNTLEIIEFIELNKLLGAKKFIIYNESMSEEVSCVLNYYIQKENLVRIIKWDLLSKIDASSVAIRGVLSALNDCIYRNMNEFHYLMQIDLDEFIIPRIHNTIPEMLKYLDSHKTESVKLSRDQIANLKKTAKLRKNSRKTTAYSFQNAMFYLRFGKKL